MKKMIFSLLAIAATMNVMAITFDQKVKLYISDGQDSYYNVLGVSADGTVASPMNFTNRDFALYVKANGNKYQNYTQASLDEVELGLMTNASTSYTLTATDVIGTITIKLLDGSLFVIDHEGATTTFTAPANQAEITGMVINPHAIPTEFKVCHQYGKIIVDNPETTALDVLLDDEKIGEADAETYGSVIEVPGTVADGQHTLKIKDQEWIISVQ